MKFKVQSLDVWGHNAADCIHYQCRCVDSANETIAHNDNKCECHFEINNVFNIGLIEINIPKFQDIFNALTEKEYLNCELENINIVIEEKDILLLRKDNGKPILFLSAEDQ